MTTEQLTKELEDTKTLLDMAMESLTDITRRDPNDGHAISRYAADMIIAIREQEEHLLAVRTETSA